MQGAEAGGHQGTFLNASPNGAPLATLLDEVRAVTALPLVAGGAIMTGDDATAALASGASAVALGTALLLSPEAGTTETHRRALRDARFGETVVTRAYTGRFGRGLANRFAREFGGLAPAAYPEVHHLTRPLPRRGQRCEQPRRPQPLGGNRLATGDRGACRRHRQPDRPRPASHLTSSPPATWRRTPFGSSALTARHPRRPRARLRAWRAGS